MPSPRRIRYMPFVLVPTEVEGTKLEDAVRTAIQTCRVGHLMGLQPMCPLLYFLTFLSPGELAGTQRKLFLRWFRRADRIWLRFAGPEGLDALSYEVLDMNKRTVRHARVPVYQLHSAGEELLPIPMTPEEVDELMLSNITAGLARCGI